MKLVEKLLGNIHSAFDKDAHSFVAFRARHVSDEFYWVVEENVLTGYVGSEQIFSFNLIGRSIWDLVNLIGSANGMRVVYAADRNDLGISAATLVDGTYRQRESNGDNFRAYTSLLWAYLHAIAVELGIAKQSIQSMGDQLVVKTAEGEWLDEWGDYFGVTREADESDQDYGTRIIVEVIRPRGNNKAIEQALLDYFGQQSSVNDLVRWGVLSGRYDNTGRYDGSILHDSNGSPEYGLFEVVIGYDLESGKDMQTFGNQVRAFIEKMRDAGTHLDSLRLSSSVLNDSVDPPTDSFGMLNIGANWSENASAPTESQSMHLTLTDTPIEAFTAPTDGATSLSLTYSTKYSGLRTYNGAVNHNSGDTVVESL